MIDAIKEHTILFAIFMAWLIGFHFIVVGLAAVLKTFWQTRWSDRRKAAVLVVTALSIVPAILIAWQTHWALLLAFGMAPYASWKMAHDEKRYRD